MRITENRRKKIFKYAAIVFLIVFLLAAALLILEFWEKQRSGFPEAETEDPTVVYNGTEYVPREDIETFLVIGLDKFEDAIDGDDTFINDQQADFLMLFVFDNAAQKCTAIQINRDTMAKVNVLGVAGNKVDTVTKQIALSHTYGNGRDLSCRNTADAVSGLLMGIRVNHYISFTMDSVVTLNDLAGGVEVTVLDDFTGVDDTLVKGEAVTLFGEHALTYVRARQGVGDGSNVARMKRQQQYTGALYHKTQRCIEEDDEFIVRATLEMADYIVSDRSVTQLQEIVRKFTEYDFVEIEGIDGESKVGEKYMEFYPDEDAVKDIVIRLFYKPKA